MVYFSIFSSMPGLIEAEIANHQSFTPEMYERIFIAYYEDQQAGLLALKYHGDK